MTCNDMMRVKHPSICILGAGALGSFYGACFIKAGFQVSFFEHHCPDVLRAEGLTLVRGKVRETFSNLIIYDRLEKIPPADRVLICLKTTQNGVLRGQLQRLVGPGGAIICMQNGMHIEEDIARYAPGLPIFAALCFVSVRKLNDSTVENLDSGHIGLAEYVSCEKSVSGLADVLATELRALGVPISVEKDVEELRWKKLLWNAPFNGLSVVLNATANEIAKCPEGQKLVKGIMDEIFRVAAARGKHLPPSFPNFLLQHTAAMSPAETSLGRDLKQGRVMEIETMFSQAIRLACESKVPVPQLEFLTAQLEFLQKKILRREV